MIYSRLLENECGYVKTFKNKKIIIFSIFSLWILVLNFFNINVMRDYP